ncbi:MAG: nucleoside triphosphate pyrophosphohydrolase [Oleispira antarctica]|uniref:Nucleoside triphosphate pyrophosphohydrolase n=1 Tax=Oleispira antarctica RB-8 TaxID=698738 RepID=R4YLP9_OLEAN|nr:nucleoside triphosphate pyrophosphohydrolase [Oleispira antarctica]MBQ0793849.1 nucleoside triphosphate pyrophosphohydrolase [Oleispira antarctica]CCK75647.1 MazG family protein [Oleispira antarctica RB-8]
MDNVVTDKKYDLKDLVYLMQRLRDPESGCPWDIKQTFDSIIPHTLEEAHEVAEAIESQDWPHVEEELGDLLFQVIFYSQLGDEQTLFDFSSVIHVLVTKLVRRHPHVFPSGDLHAKRDLDSCPTDAEINAQWQIIKQQEKALKAEAGRLKLKKSEAFELVDYLNDIPTSLPELTRADKIQKMVSMRGFDWSEIQGVLDKVREELQEVEEEIEQADVQRLQHEVGDLLFASVNVARHLGINPEQALGQANRRFSERYSLVAESLAAQNRSLELGNSNHVSSDEMEQAWNEAKKLHPQRLAQLAAANDV